MATKILEVKISGSGTKEQIKKSLSDIIAGLDNPAFTHDTQCEDDTVRFEISELNEHQED